MIRFQGHHRIDHLKILLLETLEEVVRVDSSTRNQDSVMTGIRIPMDMVIGKMLITTETEVIIIIIGIILMIIIV